jgi:hypothetical protein
MPQITGRLEQKVMKTYRKELWIGLVYEEDDKFLRLAL